MFKKVDILKFDIYFYVEGLTTKKTFQCFDFWIHELISILESKRKRQIINVSISKIRIEFKIPKYQTLFPTFSLFHGIFVEKRKCFIYQYPNLKRGLKLQIDEYLEDS